MTDPITRALPGMMELLPGEQLAFDRMMAVIARAFAEYGFVPLDTPAVERASVLLAGTGGETAKQIYRIARGEGADGDEALRFDLTVPLARYVVEHMQDLSFPFRRYHIAKVYRGERPQAGRFREFYQCDIDVIGRGTLALAYDAELTRVIYAIFRELEIGKFTIRVNNRLILNGLMEHFGVADKVTEVLRIVDKVAKIRCEQLKTELAGQGLTPDQISTLLRFIEISGEPIQAIAALRELGIANDQFTTGVAELEEVTRLMSVMGIDPAYFAVDLSIARGLDYYTGTVYETTLDDYPGIGSVCSGGRYENLASRYTDEELPGVGISIGLTRLFSQLLALGLIKAERSTPAQVGIIPLNGTANAVEAAFRVAEDLRSAGIATDVLFEPMKAGKAFKWADKLGVPYVVVIGPKDVANDVVTVQHMGGDFSEGQQRETVARTDVAAYLQERV